MANLPEPGVTPGSLAPVRRIETTDPVLGGDPELAGNVNSPINYALQSLVNRDAYLEAKIAQAVTRVTDQTEGTPEITDPLMFGDPSDGNKNKKSEIGEVLALDLYFSKQATYEASGEYNDASEMSFRNAANAVLSNNASWSAATSLLDSSKRCPVQLGGCECLGVCGFGRCGYEVGFSPTATGVHWHGDGVLFGGEREQRLALGNIHGDGSRCGEYG